MNLIRELEVVIKMNQVRITGLKKNTVTEIKTSLVIAD